MIREDTISASRPIHLTGSLSLSSERECFRKVTSIAGPAVARLPDGETGARGGWIGWQGEKFMCNPFLEQGSGASPGANAGEYGHRKRFVLKNGVDPAQVRFDELGYADAAIQSYSVYADLKRNGEIRANTRFQVSLPTPVAVLTAFVEESAQQLIEPALEQGFLNEVRRIVDTIPQSELAVQWDVAVEFGILEVDMPFYVEDKKGGIVSRLVKLGDFVPADVELGYHLCYGNMGLKHFKEPHDMALLVEISNAILAGIQRRVDWLHMPVPIERDDASYFAPLANLQRQPETRLFLGLLHMEDGLEGAARRMRAAARYVEDFGVASECGMSNRPEGWTEQMLALHREAAALDLGSACAM